MCIAYFMLIENQYCWNFFHHLHLWIIQFSANEGRPWTHLQNISLPPHFKTDNHGFLWLKQNMHVNNARMIRLNGNFGEKKENGVTIWKEG